MNFDRTLFLDKFSQEARDLIQRLNEQLIALEKTPDRSELIRDLMRTAHTLKGSAKIMRITTVSQIAHNMEEILIGIQEGRLQASANIIELLFKSTDILTQCVDALRSAQHGAPDLTALHAVLDAAGRGEEIGDLLVALRAPFPPATPTEQIQPIQKDVEGNGLSSDISAEPSRAEETIRISVSRLDHVVRLVGELAGNQRKSTQRLAILKDLQRLARQHASQLQDLFLKSEGRTLSANQKGGLLRETEHIAKALDTLFKAQRDDLAVSDIVLNELYEHVLSLRMLPLSTVFEMFPRAVRDMAKHGNKEIEFRMAGGETVLDKKIIEKLSSPLIHLLKNCIDHGIETPQERIAQGKPAKGLIMLSAHPKSGHIEITITDDGRGIQLDKLRQRLIQRAVLSEEQARTLSETELMNMIFLPGVSTSEMITDISGRGVGMEIVKSDLERLKGTIAVSSAPQRGTRFGLTLPVTLINLHSLIVSAQQQAFAIPIDAIAETFHIPAHDNPQRVERQTLPLRDQMLRVVGLADLLGLPGQPSARWEHNSILVLRTGGEHIGLVVDAILDEQHVVVKPLPAHLRQSKTLAGATISGDNSIILILHIPEIIKRIEAVGQPAHDPSLAQMPVPRRILLVEDSGNTREIEQRMLEAQGYVVDLAHDGVEALEYTQHTRYALIVTDVEMPRMDGFTLTEQLRALPDYAHTPIVIVTSLERASERQRGIQVGADAYLSKGDFEHMAFVETVNSLLRRRPS